MVIEVLRKDICDNSLHLIANLLNFSSRNLRGLGLAMCDTTIKGIMEAVLKLPLLEELQVLDYVLPQGGSLKVVDQSCPNLKTLKINCLRYGRHRPESDEFALAIAATMHGLRHLQLFGSRLTNVGLNAILDNCPDLEHLDLRHCFNLELGGDLVKQCSEKIKVVRFPNDSISDYPYRAKVFDLDSLEEEVPYQDIVSDDEF